MYRHLFYAITKLNVNIVHGVRYMLFYAGILQTFYMYMYMHVNKYNSYRTWILIILLLYYINVVQQ